MGRVARTEVRQKLVDLPNNCLATSPMFTRSVSLSFIVLRDISFPTFQESDAEKSDQDLVVDVANEVRDCH